MRVLTMSLAGSAAALNCAAAMASGLQVTPVSLTLKSSQNADGLWLSNTADEVLHAQVRVYRWSQDEGKDKLEPTREIVVSPPMVKLAAGDRQLIRVIRPGPPPSGAAEQAYRLVIDELPLAKTERKGLKYVLRYTLPVFVQPVAALPGSPQLEWALRKGSDPSLLEVTNKSDIHAQVADVTFIDSRGMKTVVAPGLLGYALPGSNMKWAVNVPAIALGGSGSWQVMINGVVAPQSIALLDNAR